MNDSEETVYVVDDEESLRRSLTYLLESVKLRVEAFDSAESLLKGLKPASIGCIVLDVRMPGMSGPELMDHLNQRGCVLPIIFLSAHGDVSLAVRAMRGGAVDFLQKPPNSQVFLECVRRALAQGRKMHREQAKSAVINARLATLTAREREVLDRLVAGDNNKTIARSLTVSYKTAEAHRARVMRKMQATSYPDLVRMMLVIRRCADAPGAQETANPDRETPNRRTE
jgi:two-component system response regulator FixJ